MPRDAPFIIVMPMNTLDPRLTREVQEWLQADSSERSVSKGADLLLSLSRNRALTNSYLRSPQKYEAKVVYELRKFLNIRLHNMSVADVARIEPDIMAKASELIDETPLDNPVGDEISSDNDSQLEISVDDEFPPATVAKGRRPDHDSLPEHIQDLWNSNGPRFQKIVLLFNELKAMSDMQPCDRFEKLSILASLDSKYRENLEAYDAYTPPPAPTPEELAQKQLADQERAQTEKALNAARKSLSKYKKVCKEADDPQTRERALDKMRTAVDTIRSLGGEFADTTVAELAELGISIG